MNLREQNILVFDMEIKNAIDMKSIRWTDYHLMGHAVSASYNFKTDDYKIYFDDNLSDLIEDINGSDMVTGFNIKGFDLPLLEVCANHKFKEDLNVYDMLYVSRDAADGKFSKGLKLDDHLRAMFGPEGMKSGHGADAPILWQTQKFGSLCSYVLRDVNREKALFEYIWQHGCVETATHGRKEVKKPQECIFALGF